MNVTTLGSGGGSPGGAVGSIVNYLEGNQPELDARMSRQGSQGAELETGGPGAYYADSGAGRWIGQGTLGTGFALDGPVQREHFARLLMGQDPHSGEQIMHNVGSAQRRESDAVTRDNAIDNAIGAPEDLLSIQDISKATGIDDSYLRKLVRATDAATQQSLDARAKGLPEPGLPETVLEASKVGRNWMIERQELDRFMTGRKPQQIVHGYDITFSAQKSVSVLWAASSAEVQTQISRAMTVAVEAGMNYLETEGLWVRRGRGEEQAHGMAAAAYRHDTSRALEPQLHDHVVIPNMGWGGDGRIQALDARGLHAHATTAGHVADAVLRRELTQSLGVQWGEVHKGAAEIEGVPIEAVRAMSTRRSQILAMSEQVGASSIHGRQVAALVTRADKGSGIDESELRAGWSERLAEHGLNREVAASLTPGPNPELDREWGGILETRLFREMSGARGVTESNAVFDRRDVIQWLTDRVGGQTEIGEVMRLGDCWLAQNAVPLRLSNSWETIGRSGKVALSHGQMYSTPQMIGLEQRVLALHRAGLDQQVGLVEPRIVETAIAGVEARLGFEMGHDQAQAVRDITTSGHQFQAVQGLAGAGKTTAMSVAVEAWQQSGYEVIGLAPFGAAAAKLGQETGVEARTVDSFLVRAQTASDPSRILGRGTVLLVDEASTLSNRQLDQLYRLARDHGSVIRSVGDPMQHQAIAARGLWNELVAQNEASTPVLDVNRRQNPETMQTVRDALQTWRHGGRGDALNMLAGDGRIKTADTWPELLDNLAEDWYSQWVKSVEAGGQPPQMIAERNRDRAELNPRAQAHRKTGGELGADVVIGDSRFHVGDRVVAQAANRDLRPDGAGSREHVLNGSTGVVASFAGPESSPDLVIDFDDLGRVRVPNTWIDTDVGQGRGGGVALGYAVTSYKAEGQTYDASLGLAQPGAVNAQGLYVTLTRGRDDLSLYSIAPNKTPDRSEQEIGRHSDPRTMSEALRASVERESRPNVATAADTGIAGALDALSPTSRTSQVAEAQAAAMSIHSPDPVTVAAVGERPAKAGPHQGAWDEAVAGKAIYEHRYGTNGVTVTGAPGLAAEADKSQVRDHRQVGVAFEVAQRAGVAQMPLEALVAERRLLSVAGPKGQIEQLEMQAASAVQAVGLAQDRFDIAMRTIDPAGTGEGRHLRASELTAAQTSASETRNELEGFVTQHEPSAVRQELLDKAFTWRVNAAVSEPSRYLIEVIGPKPGDGDGVRAWDRAAHMTERVRHNHGLTPNHGPQAGETPMERAVGTENAGWEPLVRLVHEVELTQTPALGIMR